MNPDEDRRYKRHETDVFMGMYNSLSNAYMTRAEAEVVYEDAERLYEAQFGRRRFSNYTTFLTSRARFIKKRHKVLRVLL